LNSIFAKICKSGFDSIFAKNCKSGIGRIASIDDIKDYEMMTLLPEEATLSK